LSMNYIWTSCRCSYAEVFGHLKISALNRFDWKD
jgi:hypothetical protein